MLTPRELREMRALTQRITNGAASREDWSNLAALTIVWQGDATVMAIISRGFDEFVRVARDVYDDRGFQPMDYVRMYARLEEAATRYTRDLVPS